MTIKNTSCPPGVRVLIVDDEDDIRLGLRKILSPQGFICEEACDGLEALEILASERADLVLTDLMMPRMGGSDLLREIKDRYPGLGVVVFTGYGTIQTAVSCLRGGAAHFLTKPFDIEEVTQIVERMARQVTASRAKSEAAHESVIAVDSRMRRVLELVERVARSPVPILLEGESGTGKEVMAQLIHKKSHVAGRPFQVVNTTALPDSLLESELFGHRKGAFTGADSDRDGLFVSAQGGTVFLDEVASMSPSFQGKLLRVLQEKKVRPLGTSRDIDVDFRLVAATNQDLKRLSDEGKFREDLFYRLGVVRVHLPALRERPSDVLPLARHFLERSATICLGAGDQIPELGPSAMEALQAHNWPGNVRELENSIQRAVVVCGGDEIRAIHLGLDGGEGWGCDEDQESEVLDYNSGKKHAIERFQREFVQRALERSGGNISRAAEHCGMTRAALQRILRQLSIDAAEFR